MCVFVQSLQENVHIALARCKWLDLSLCAVNVVRSLFAGLCATCMSCRLSSLALIAVLMYSRHTLGLSICVLCLSQCVFVMISWSLVFSKFVA